MPPPWRNEPFRLFFPLGVLLAWVGIGHWLLYSLGATRTYSCLLHGLVQMQGFMMAFAIGFLLTAVPRRTRTEPPSAIEIALLVAALVMSTAATVLERWVVAETAYLALFAVLLRFAVVRLRGAEGARRPPAAFVLIPIAVLHGVVGAVLILRAMLPGVSASLMGLGRLLVEQGVFLCLAVGIGALVLPLMAGTPPPMDLGTVPGERRKAFLYAAAGVAIGMSLVLEYMGWERLGPLLRAAVVTAGFGLGGGAWRPPHKPGLHRRLVWLAVWLVPTGLVVSALWPSYRVPALHILFIGGFSLMAFGVATHVALSHLGLEALAAGRPRAVLVLAASFLLALAARLAADASNTYFDHLGWAAGLWITGSAVWLAFLGPHLLQRERRL
ncbi:MAG TPA: NnrS family protein [Candidatus Nitrosopolaris sp.]|nr:NnrS family protein [Candidatus Nitrosopolaris sp.]